jgi:hypothetical protein
MYFISSWAGGVGRDSVSCVARKVDAIEIAERYSWGGESTWLVACILWTSPLCIYKNSLQKADWWYLLVSLSVAARGFNLTECWQQFQHK